MCIRDSSYTSFRLGPLHLRSSAGRDELGLSVTNTGGRSGTDVVECYLSYPASAGEPPYQLRAFARVELRSGATRSVTLSLTRPSFEIFKGRHFVVPTGAFTAWVGSSANQLSESAVVVAPTS